MIFKNFGIHGNRSQSKFCAKNLGFNVYLRSIKIPAKFEPNRKYAWGQPTRNAHKEKARYGRLLEVFRTFQKFVKNCRKLQTIIKNPKKLIPITKNIQNIKKSPIISKIKLARSPTHKIQTKKKTKKTCKIDTI
jgi:hypothetical protein